MKPAICIFISASFLLVACGEKYPGQKVSSHGSAAESVFLTHDQHKNPVVVWTERSGEGLALFFSVSQDEGRSFQKKVSVALSSAVATHAEGMPKVAFKKDGTIVVAYETRTPSRKNKYAGTIQYIMSNDGGESWTEEAFLHSDTVSGRSRSYFDIERLPDGEIGASWLDINMDAETGGRSVRFARTLKARGFGNDILIDSTACQCCRIDVYTDEGAHIFVAYRGLKRGRMGRQIRDMMIATSTDQGASFSAPLLISADNWNIEGCPHTGPSLCGNKAGLFTLWYTEGSGAGIYYARKPGDENEFAERQLVSYTGSHPQLCANGDLIAMLWEENVKVDERVRTVIHCKIVRNGVDIVSDILTSTQANAFFPVITNTQKGFVVAYLMEGKDDVGVYVRTLEGNHPDLN